MDWGLNQDMEVGGEVGMGVYLVIHRLIVL